MRLLRGRGSRPGRRPARARSAQALAVLAAGALAACAAPEHRFVASGADDVVIKVPRSWSVVRDGAPRSDPTTPPEPDGAWEAVYDGDRKPDVKHLSLTNRPTAPVALARTWVVTKEQAEAATSEALRNMILPVTPAARAAATGTPFIATFRLETDEDVRSRIARGAHVVFSYDLGDGKGREVFDQIAMVTSSKNRVHLFVVHCTQACYEAHRDDISSAVKSFTVKVP